MIYGNMQYQFLLLGSGRLLLRAGDLVHLVRVGGHIEVVAPQHNLAIAYFEHSGNR